MKKIVLFDIDYTLFNTDDFKKSNLRDYYLYEETEKVLEEVSKIATLGIFSEGELEFQKTKLIKTNIQKYFNEDHTHIVEKKDLNLELVLSKFKDEKLYFIDDKLQILFNAKKVMPSIFTIWVKRGIYANAQKPIQNFKPDATIDNLSEVFGIVSKN